MAGDSVNAPQIHPIAKKITKECGGLPLAITTIGRALSNKSKVTWEEVLGQLEKSALEGEYAAVFNTLKVSYDFLEPEEIKDCFVLCSLFPEGFDVPIENLVRYAMALRLFKNIRKLQEARIRAHAHVEKLKHSNLLLSGDLKQCVKMHDLVRDFALSNASKGLYMVRHGLGLTEWPMEDTYNHYTSISLQCEEMDGLPEGLECPKLKLLQLVGGTHLAKFPGNFYKGMAELNVLVFRRMFIPLPPKSVQLLSNVRTLSLNHCKVNDDVSTIQNLEKLEILSFAYSSMVELPKEIGKLTRLRLLDLTRCGELRIAPGVFLGLIRLEELYMGGTRFHSSKATVNELSSLSKLVVIDIDIPYEVLPAEFHFDKLETFKISIDLSNPEEYLPKYMHRFLRTYKLLLDTDQFEYRFENTLKLVLDTSALLQGGAKVLLKRTEIMLLQVQGLKALLNDSETGDFLNLKILLLESCCDLLYLVNAVRPDENNVFPALGSLYLYDLNNLKEIYYAQHPGKNFITFTPFWNLRIIDVRDCNKLKSIFPLSIARGLVKLEQIKIAKCKMMEEIFSKERGNRDENATMGKVEFPHLKYLVLDNLPSFVGFCKDAVELPQLVHLQLENLPLLTSLWPEVKTPSLEHDHTSHDHPFFNQKDLHEVGGLQNVRSLIVKSCSGLRHLFTPSRANCFGELRHLEVISCTSLQAIVAAEGQGDEEEEYCLMSEGILFPQLNHLHLAWLPKLSTIMPKAYTFHWPSLKKLIVETRRRESDIFANMNRIPESATEQKIALTSLEDMEIGGSNMAELWINYQFPARCSYELRTMKLFNCNELSAVFSSRLIQGFNHLEKLYLFGCDSLEVVFDLDDLIHRRECGVVFLDRLYELKMRNLPRMTHVWKNGPQVFEGFHNLTWLDLRQCDGLRYLFLPSIAKFLVKLRKLNISTCREMGEIISKEQEFEDQENTNEMDFFPELDHLVLASLPNLLQCFGPGASASANTSTSTSMFTEELALAGSERPNRLHTWSLYNLSYVNVVNCDNLLCVFPSNAAPKVRNLQELFVYSCDSLVEIFEVEGSKSDEGHSFITIPKLEKIELEHLPKLMYISGNKNCHSMGFPNLKYVGIMGCGLRYMFCSSTVKSLVQLKHLEIRYCRMMSTIVMEEDGPEERETVVFPHLESIRLEGLSKLEAFCLGLCSFEWPSLESVEIRSCKKMMTFTNGYSNSPNLRYVRMKAGLWSGEDLNTFVKSEQRASEHTSRPQVLL